MNDWSTEAAEALAAEIWGVKGRATSLAAERDANFRLDPVGGGTAQVLKISHPDEDPALAAFQCEALVHARLSDPALPVPKVLPTLSGGAWHRLDGERPRIARMVAWLDGQPMAGAAATPAFRDRLGALIARLDLALAGFAAPAPRQDFVWDLSQAASLRGMLHHVPDADARALASRALDRFADDVAPRLPGLRRQVIHNDMNPHNILIEPEAPDRPAAIIDFGDLVEAPLVNELAIALAYQPVDSYDPLGPAAELAAGYTRILPLRRQEIEILPVLIAARRATTIVVSSWRAEAQPRNRDYLLRSWQGALAGLSAFEQMPAGSVNARLAAACATEGTPA